MAMARKRRALSERFWAKVDKAPGHGPRGECWVWTGHRDADGYGRLKGDGSGPMVERANRVALRLHLQRQLTEDEYACHGCDFPPCVRVGDGHIFLGDHAANMADAASKGRVAAGESHGLRKHRDRASRGAKHSEAMRGRASHGDAHWMRRHPEWNSGSKLSPPVGPFILWLLSGGVSVAAAAARFGVSRSTIYRVKAGRTWTRALAAMLLLVVAVPGCGGGHRSRPQAPAPLPTPTVEATPAARHRVPCWSYVARASADDFAAMWSAGVVAVMDYDQLAICERSKAYPGKLIFPIYYGGGGTYEQIEQITRDQARNVEGCRDRVAMVYVYDEPEARGISRSVVEMAIASAAREFPTLPRLITFTEKSKLPAYAGLTLRGAELYSRSWRDMGTVRKRIVDASVLPVPRAFDNGGKYWGDWSDQDRADFVHRLASELAAGPAVAALFYTHADNLTPGKRDRGWRDLPLTRAAIAAVCR